MKNKADYITYSIYAILVIVLFTFIRTCNNRSTIKEEADNLKNENTELKNKIDSVSSLIITEERMTELIKEVPAWNTLRIEEISDKEKISINALERNKKNAN